MTVRELIAALSALPEDHQDLTVAYPADSKVGFWGESFEVGEVGLLSEVAAPRKLNVRFGTGDYQTYQDCVVLS